jgi:hypothetical protein|tara:strand:+ start:625 stop:930 length:306 start_codon:yes stop_codon:yes gene_type:complete
MRPIAVNVYILMMSLAYVMRRAGTFSMEEKVKMIEYFGYMALNPNKVVNPSIANLPFLISASGVNAPIFSVLKFSAVNRDASANVVTTPVAAIAYAGSSTC